MRLAPLDVQEVFRNPKRGPLLGFVSSLADLAQPKPVLRILEDTSRLSSYQQALDALFEYQNVQENCRNLHVLTLGAGGGVLPLIAAAKSPRRVTAVERGRMLYRMAKQIVGSNSAILPKNTTLQLVPCSLESCRVKQETAPTDNSENSETGQMASNNIQKNTATNLIHSSGTGADPQREVKIGNFEYLPDKADILLTDLFDHAGLGLGVLKSIDYAAEHLLKKGAIALPSKLHVFAMLAEIKLPDTINGFDLSPLDTYRWWPGDERVDLERINYKPLSKPFLACEIDLQQRIASVQSKITDASELSEMEEAKAHNENSQENMNGAPKSNKGCLDDTSDENDPWEQNNTVSVSVTADGQWNAVLFWFEIDLLPEHEINPSNRDGELVGQKKHRKLCLSSLRSNCLESNCRVSSNGCSDVNVEDNCSKAVSETDVTDREPVFCPSWGQAVQYVDNRALTTGDEVKLNIRQDDGQIIFQTDPPACKLRNNLAPRWHFDMVLDSLRNDAYDEAIRNAITKKIEAECTDITVIDIGAGTGLLSMMAARAGAKEVFACEISSHMTDVAEETVIMNGFFDKITVFNKDVRRMDTQPRPDGTPADLPRRANMAVFEIFDSGLIGEGALHLLSYAHHKLLTAGSVLVPANATVYAQPIEFRVKEVLGFNVEQANQWKWRPEYEGIELNRCRDQWKPLAPPQEVFTFDFYNAPRYMCPDESLLQFHVSDDGVCNAIAMWFDLHLDEDIMLSTSPYEDKGPTWQQAVQWMPEISLREKDVFIVTARHDTYSISYEIEMDKNKDITDLGERHTGVPLIDPIWKKVHDTLQSGNSQLVKACVQNPLEFRAAAQSAVAFAARPHDLGLDRAQAIEFCMKLMG